MSAAPEPGQRTDWLPFFAYSVIGTFTIMPLLVLPALIGTLVDEGGMGESFAGWVASANFAGGATAALLMAFRMHGLDLQRVATIAILVSIGGDIVSAWLAHQGYGFLALRFLTGFAASSVHVAASAAFARHANVERGYGLFITLQFIVSGIGLYVVPVFSHSLGVTGLFLLIAGLQFASLPLLRFLPGRALEVRSGGRTDERRILLAAVTLFALLGYGLFESANTAQFTYIERWGVALTFSDGQIGVALMVASLAGIPGAFFVILMGHRWGYLRPLLGGMLLAVAGLALLILTRSYVPYFAAGCFLGFSWAFCLPYIQSLMASIDRNGSAVAAGSSIATIGGAVGPGLAALVVVGGNYRGVFLLSIVLFAVAATSFIFSRSRAAAPVIESVS